MGRELPRLPPAGVSVLAPIAAAGSQGWGGRSGPLSTKVQRSKIAPYSINTAARIVAAGHQLFRRANGAAGIGLASRLWYPHGEVTAGERISKATFS